MVGNKKRKSEVNAQSKSKTTNSKPKCIPQYQLFLHPSAPGNKLTVLGQWRSLMFNSKDPY